MELPKNITQIGESDHNCKIYVEDYVISYIKQMNRLAENKQIAVAVYGTRKSEQDVSYLFFYGACRLDFLTREVRHLSQAQKLEIDKQRKRYFPDYEFLGYRLLNGEMVEGFHICEQEICRYIKGYACFYEKNDSMLAYMLDSREEEAKPEEVDQEKYDQVRQRQEARRQQHEEEIRSGRAKRERISGQEGQAPAAKMEDTGQAGETRSTDGQVRPRGQARRSLEKKPERSRVSAGREQMAAGAPSSTLKVMRAGVVGMFALLCVVGVTTLNGSGKLDRLQVAARQLFQELTEKKIPDAGDAVAAMNQSGQTDTLVAEDKLADAIAQENQGQETVGQNGGSETVSPDNTGTNPNSTAPVNTDLTDPVQESTTPSEAVTDSAAPGNEASDNTEQSTAPAPEANNSVQSETPQQPQPETQPQAPQPETQQVPAPVAYTIQAGDTLIGICTRVYGSDGRVQEVCTLNNITNPDNICIGQKILLPQ